MTLRGSGAVAVHAVRPSCSIEGRDLRQILRKAGAKDELRDRRDDVSGPLEAVLRGALEKERALRFQTAKEFADAVSPHFHPVRAPRKLADVVKELFAR